MSQRLPSLPNLQYPKKQAKDVLRVSRHRSPRWRLADAQHALARGYGFSNWPDLKLHVESRRRQPGMAAHPRQQEQQAAENNGALLVAAAHSPGGSSHPIVGTWAAQPRMAAGNHQHAGNVVVET